MRVLPFEQGDSPHFFKVDRGNGVEFVYVTEDGRMIPAEDYQGPDYRGY